jgi:hypothetical protein
LRRRTALLCAFATCGARTATISLESTNHALTPVTGTVTVADLTIAGQVSAFHEPARGWDLQLVVDLRNDAIVGDVRFDLVRTEVKSDKSRWIACEHDPKTDQDQLIFRMAPGDTKTVTLTCLDVPRPDKALAFRFQTAGLGQTPIELDFAGVKNGAQPVE